MAVKSKRKTKKVTRARTAKKTTKSRVLKSRKVAAKKSAPRASAKNRQVKKVVASARPQANPKPEPKGQVYRAPARRSIQLPARPPLALRSASPMTRRVVNPLIGRRSAQARASRAHQFLYMKAPGLEHEFGVGDSVEVYCDHEKNRERIRGWVKGIVVQVDNKLVAVQFRSNVFLTDGWMVPDRILWYPVNSEHIRPMPGKKPVKSDFIPEY